MSNIKGSSLRKRPRAREQEYESLWLKYQADIILGIPPGSERQPKYPMPELWIGDLDRLKIATYLRRISEDPAVLKVLTRNPKQRTRLGRPAQAARNHRIALDYMVTYQKLEKSEAATAEMRRHWKIRRTRIMKIYETCLTDRGWLEWGKFVIRQAKIDNEPLEEISRKIRQST